MADVTKRLRYFDGQVLEAQDFTDEQHYVLDRQRRYSRFLNAAGLVDGLEVSPAAAPGQVEVRPGTALDAQGRQVVLSDARTVSLAERKNQTVELVIAYCQEEGDPQPTEAGPVGHTRFHEEPYVGPNSPLPPGITDTLTLACVTLGADGAVTRVDETPRVYAGIHLPDGKGTTGGMILRAHTSTDNRDPSGWQDVRYENQWERYTDEDGPAQYWKDSQGIVHLRGLMKGRTLSYAFTLPDGYRPAYRQSYVVWAHNNTLGRVDVLPDGQVMVLSGDTTEVSLDGIAFQAADTSAQAAWQDVTYVNNWQSYSSEYSPAQYWKDSRGIVYLRGLMKGGRPSAIEAARAFTLPDGYRPDNRQLHVVWAYNNTLGRVDVLSNGQVRVLNGDTQGVSLDGIAFRAADTSAQAAWQEVTYVNNWVRYATSEYNQAQYWKDSQGIVYLRGLIQSGTPGDSEAGRVFTLPDGYRPTHRQLYGVGTRHAQGETVSLGRVDVLPNGNVVVVSGDTRWVSLDSIAFRIAASSPAEVGAASGPVEVGLDSIAMKGLVAEALPREVLPRIVSGVFNSDGSTQVGVGFTSRLQSTGVFMSRYEITFDPPFAVAPAVSVTPIIPVLLVNDNFSTFNYSVVLSSLESTGMIVSSLGLTQISMSFSFIAIGPQ